MQRRDRGDRSDRAEDRQLQDALNDPVRILGLKRVEKPLAPTIDGKRDERVHDETNQKAQGQEPSVAARLTSPKTKRKLNKTLNLSSAIEFGPQFFIQKGPLLWGAFSPVVGVTEGGRSPTGVTPTTAAV